MDFAVTAHGIAAIIFAFRCFEERHEVQIRNAQFFEVRDLGFHPFEISREKVNVANSAQHLVRLEPKWILLPGIVQFAQINGSCKPCRSKADQQIFKMKKEIVLLVINVKVQLEELWKMFLQAR